LVPLIARPVVLSPLAGALVNRWTAGGALLVFVLYTRLFDIPLGRLPLEPISSRGVSASELCIACLVLVVLARRLIAGQARSLSANAWPWILISVYVSVTYTATFWAPDQARAAAQASYLIRDVVLVFILVELCDSARAQRVALWSLLAAGTLLAVLSIFQAATHSYDNNYLGLAHAEIRQIVGRDNDYRAGGPIGDANFYGLILTALLPVAVLRARDESRPMARGAALGCALALLGAIVLTYSRGALVALAGGVVLWILLARVRRAVLIVLLLVLTVGAFLIPRNYWERVAGSTLGDHTILSRVRSQEIALAVFIDHPLVGHGTDSYPDVYGDYAARLNLPGAASHIHNTYLAVAADNGLAGLVPFAGALVLVLRRAWRRRTSALRESDKQAEGRVLACFLALTTYLIGIVFLPLAYPRYLWMLAGLTMAAGVPDEESARR
jgi:O-antigen ligase